jgi:hypothetical protein
MTLKEAISLTIYLHYYFPLDYQVESLPQFLPAIALSAPIN